MTKVEELRDKVLGNYHKIATDEKGLSRIVDIIETVDSLISTVYADGKEEGAAWGLSVAQRWIDSEQLRGRRVISLPRDVLLASALVSREKPCSG